MAEPAGGQLRRAMKFRDLVLFYVTSVVGLRWIAVAAEHGPSSFVVWGIACVALFIPLAFTVLELSSRYPQEGGIYVWTKEAFGDFAGFLTGWNYWASNLVYFPGLLFFGAGASIYVFDPSGKSYANDPTYYTAFALFGVALAVSLNVVGLNVGKWLPNVGAFSTWLIFGALVAMGAVAWSQFGAATDFASASYFEGASFAEVAYWSTLAFGFGGLESASTMGGEIQDARRAIPRAIIVAGACIAIIYVIGTLALLVALPEASLSGLQGIPQAISASSVRLGIPWVVPVLAAVITVAALGGVGAWMTTTSRLPFVIGIDNYLPRAFGRLHPKWGSPYVALLVQAGAVAVLTIVAQFGSETVRQSYEVLVAAAVIAYFIPYAIMFAAMIKIQSFRRPEGTLSVPGGSRMAILLAAIGLITTVASIVLAVVPGDSVVDPYERQMAVLKVVGISLVILATGVALFAIGEKRRRKLTAKRRPHPHKRKKKSARR
jgi:amino acid transporter